MTILCAKDVRGHLLAARKRTLALTRDLDGARLLGPKLDVVNPPLWELGHVAWFLERWCLRRNDDHSLEESSIPSADRIYDSARVAHEARWELPLLDLRATRAFLAEALDRTLDRIDKAPEDQQLLYFAELSACHEDMHAEAFHYTWQTHGYEAPVIDSRRPKQEPQSTVTGDVELAGGEFMLGAYPEYGFVFDNEKWAHEVHVAPFSIARTAVTNAEYRAFVESLGYQRREWWSDTGWSLVQRTGALAPRYWRKIGTQWMERRFDRIQALNDHAPVMHVSWYEAEAYCRFARRRLPTEAEWEFAVSYPHIGHDKRPCPWGNEPVTERHANLESDDRVSVHAAAAGDARSGCRQMIGNVWEWTASTFEPYPGFVRDPYKEHSEPWFGTHRVLRGGSFATPVRLIRSTWRNFYLPERNDPFLGFRTCALADA